MSSSAQHILEIDCGNSRGKWRLSALAKSQDVQQGIFDYGNDFAAFLNGLPLHPNNIAGCRVVSVAPAEIKASLVSAWENFCEAPILFAEVQPESGGITCGYDDISQLGIDRWSAIIGACQQCKPPLLLVDAGTAITLDAVNAQNQHIGGYILPGFNLMLEALREKTAIPSHRIPNAEDVSSAQPGKTTSTAISGGLGLMFSSLCKAIDNFIDIDAQIILTGGSAEQLASILDTSLPKKTRVIPNLVLDGLSVLVPMSVDPV